MSQSGGSALATKAAAALHPERARGSEQLEPLRSIELIAQLSGAFDLAESQALGHAARVAHVALEIAGRLQYNAEAKRRLLRVALLHDAGVAVRQLPQDIDVSGGHSAAGAWVAELLGLDEGVQDAIRASHERWDGHGRPHGLAMAAIPEEALLVGAGHWVCDQIAPIDNPLRARAKVLAGSSEALGPLVGSRIADALYAELRGDRLWMPLWDDRLPMQLVAAIEDDEAPSLRTVEWVSVAAGDVIDSSTREPGRARRVSRLARELAGRLDFDAHDQMAIGIAGHLLDLGHLGVPRHITAKPDILSVDEMDVMRRHPGWGAQLLERIPGFGRIAGWVQHHHERADGRGYPEMLEAHEVPLGSFVLGAADAYWALRADRSDRPALAAPHALQVMESAAGEQFHTAVLAELPAALQELGEAS